MAKKAEEQYNEEEIEDEDLPPIAEQESRDGDQSESEYDRQDMGVPPGFVADDSRNQAKIRVIDKILDTDEDRMCEMTTIPRSLVIPRAAKETMIHMMEALNEQGNGGSPKDEEFNPWTFFFRRFDKLMRSVDSNQLKRATLLAGDEAREKEGQRDLFDGMNTS